MKLKKILLFMTLILMSILSVNATTYLNSCGKNSGWITGETYIINISNIDNSVLTDYCFYFGDNSINNVHFQSITPTIITKNNSVNTFSMFYFENNLGGSWVGSMLKQFNSYYFNDFFIVGNNKQSLLGESATQGLFCCYGYNQYYFTIALNDFRVENSVLVDTYSQYNYATTNNIAYYSQNIFYNNSVITKYPDTYNMYGSISFTNSLRYMQMAVDSPLYKDVSYNGLNLRFLKSATDSGNYFVANKINIPLSDETLNFPLSIYSHSVSSEFIYPKLTGNQNLIITSNEVYKNVFKSNYSFIRDDLTAIQNLATPFRALITLNGNNITIENLEYRKLNTDMKNQILGNQLNQLGDNLKIRNNIFDKRDDNGILVADAEILKLYYNNVEITNNTFYVLAFANTSYNVIDIKAGNSRTNNIYQNRFIVTDNSSIGNEIFKTTADTNFFNNYVGKGFIISSTAKPNLQATTTKAYLYNNNWYYFNIGNYYVDNLGCVDANGDGFCDNSYTSGAIVDTHPLSSYPFNYMAHLLTADDIVPNNPFNVNMLSPQNNQNFTLSSSSSVIDFSFTQNGAYPDLTCDFILNANVVNGASIVNANQSVTYTKSISSWTNSSNVLRVECYNQNGVYATSSEVTFNVNIASNGGTGGTGGGSTDYSTGGINLIDANSVSNTADNVDSFVGDFTNGLTNLIVPVAVFIIFFLVIVIVFKFIGG